MKYSKCIKIIQSNSSKPLILKAVDELKVLKNKTKTRWKIKNLQNWIDIGEAQLNPNQLSSSPFRDENQLKDALFNNPILIEKDLEMICKEFDLKIGAIDLLARDCNKKWVLIEIKSGQAIGQAIGQLLSYLFAFKFYFNKEARGILFAPKFHPQCLGAFEFINQNEIKNIELRYFDGKKVIFSPQKFDLTKNRPITKEMALIWSMIARS